MQKTARIFYFTAIILSLFLMRCANPVSPQGGPIDKKPPKVLYCDPVSNSTLFNKKSFKIEFDEFIILKNPINEIFISPPLKEPLDPRLRGKSLVVAFDDTLAANSTYSVTFGNAVADLTESNILKGFNYVFSTGIYVDSLSLKGVVMSAFDRKPVKDVHVGIYLDNNDTIVFDSLPLRVPPYYITKSDENGQFEFNNLQRRKGRLFAIADQNGDLVFNQPSEKIAFLDSLAEPFYIEKIVQDTLKNADSAFKTDSVNQAQISYPSLSLFLFEQSDSVQRLAKSGFAAENLVQLTFRFPVEHLTITPLNFDSTTPWCLTEYSAKRDSVYLWIVRTDLDTIRLKMTADKLVTDTIEIARDVKEKSQKKGDLPVASQLKIAGPPRGFLLNQFKNSLHLTWSSPLVTVDFGKVLLIEDKDTLHPLLTFTDSLHRKTTIEHPWKEEQSYRLIFPDSIFTGLNGLSHDTLHFSFRTRAEKDLGNLTLTANLPAYGGNYLVQLLNEKETMIFDQQTVTGPGKIMFNFMSAGKYRIKAIKDRNKNGKWDSGNYNLMIQPEEVLYLEKTVEIRANWDVEETWN